MAETLNKEQSHTFCSVINPITDVESLAARKLQPLQPNSLLFFVNVSSVAGRRVLATDVQRGCHWTLCQVNNVNKTIVYADTLGWKIPEGLLDKVNRFVTGVYSDDVANYKLITCHQPGHFVNGQHCCTSSCALYPVQTCTTVCGVISMVMAAIATHKQELFLQMTAR